MHANTPPGKLSGLFSRKLTIILLGVAVLASLIFSVHTAANKKITIIDNEKQSKITIFFGGTVSDALDKAGIKLKEKDIVKPGLDSDLEDGLKIAITRAVDINIAIDGQNIKLTTPQRKVKTVLVEQGIELNPMDIVKPELDAELTSGDTIEITRVAEQTITEEENISFKTERRKDNTLYRGVNRVIRSGEKGLLQRIIKVTMEDGKEVKREVVEEKVVKEPITRIVAMGTISEKVVSRGGSIRFSEVINMSATGYTYTGNNTYSGVPPGPGVVAVDPNVIPLGTKLYIDGYGYATALDIGSAIKGNKIDLFFETRSQALKWGRRNVKVYILK